MPKQESPPSHSGGLSPVRAACLELLPATRYPPSHLIGLDSAQGRRARRIGDRTSAIGGATSVCREPRADRLGVSLNIVLCVDVELQKQQQSVESLAVLQRAAASVERGADRPRELLKRGRGQGPVGRAA